LLLRTLRLVGAPLLRTVLLLRAGVLSLALPAVLAHIASRPDFRTVGVIKSLRVLADQSAPDETL
jgi:hypothetical protein